MYGILIDDERREVDDECISEKDERDLPDDRMDLRPSQIVQSKLMRLMPGMAVPVSCLHTHRDTRRGVR
jgi:hypothetical protein